MNQDRIKERFNKIVNILDKENNKDNERGSNEIVGNLYLGNRIVASNKQLLKQLGITAVLNAAQGKSRTQVNTNQEYYNDTNIKFSGFSLMDDEDIDIDKHFEEASKFIHDSIDKLSIESWIINDNPTNPGKVLVHCYQGISRSATLVLAYLMIYREMSLEDAIRLCTSKRYINPNKSFLFQLILLEDRLEGKRNKS